MTVNEVATSRFTALLCDWHSLGDSAMQLCIYLAGTKVVDIAVGTDPFTETSVTRENLFPIMSASKGVGAILMLQAHSEGLFDWGDPVERYWPGFGVNGKSGTTIADVMSHRAGIPDVTCDWSLWPDQAYMRGLVERAIPRWTPGERFGYHGGIFGTIIDEICLGATGERLDARLRRLSQRIGHENCFLGVPAEQLPKVVRLLFLETRLCDEAEMKIEFPPFGWDREFNSPLLLGASLPSSGCVSTAESLAGLYNLVASRGLYKGERCWSPDEQLEASFAWSDPRTECPASSGMADGAWGLGFQVSPTPAVFGTTPISSQVLGHAGASGAVAWGDPVTKIALAFTINGVVGRRLFHRMSVLGDLARDIWA